MKHSKPTHYLFLFLLFISLSGCITEEEVTTYFHPDGTITRLVTFKSNKKKFDLKNLCTPVDSSWTITMQKDTSDTTQYLVRAEKTFGDVQWLNSDYDLTPNALSGVRRGLSFEKKFMWFYTFYYYQETLNKVFDEYPLSDFLTGMEIHYMEAGEAAKKTLLLGMDSLKQKRFDDQVDSKTMQWMAACMFKELFTGMIKVAQQYPKEAFTKKNLIADKDSLLAIYTDDFKNLGTGNRFEDFFRNRYGTFLDSVMTRHPDKFLKYLRLQNMVSSIIGSKYENRVQMPGRTYDSNADTLVEGLCVWQVRPARFLGNDFDMFVAARQVNIWAWAVALAVLVLALGVWLIPLKKGGEESEEK